MMQDHTYYGNGLVPVSDFPGAEHAVELCEKLTQWDMYRETAEKESLYMLRQRMKGSAEAAMARATADGDVQRANVLSMALSEWDHPNFVLYLKRKLW